LAELADSADFSDAAVLELHEAVASLAAELASYERALARWLHVAQRAPGPQRRAAAQLAASKAAFELARVDEAKVLLRSAESVADARAALASRLRSRDACPELRGVVVE